MAQITNPFFKARGCRPFSLKLLLARRLALSLAILGPFVQAALAAVRFDVFLGYDGVVPEASWFPVVVEVSNDGPPIDAVFEISPGTFGQEQSRLMALELPTGTTKRFVVPVFSSGRYIYSWNAVLRNERGRAIAEQRDIRPRKNKFWKMPLLGAVTRTPPVLPDVKPGVDDAKPVVARIQPSLFPDNAIALEGLTTVYLSSDRALDLKANQARALLTWLYNGGHLVVGVEQASQLEGAPWLRDLLPCSLTGMANRPDQTRLLEDWLRTDQRVDGGRYEFERQQGSSTRSFQNPFAALNRDLDFEGASMQVASGSIRDGQVLAGTREQPLVVAAKRGRGQVTLFLFAPELEPFDGWKNRGYFWAKMISLPPELLALADYNTYAAYSTDGIFGAMVDSQQVRKLPVGWLLVLLVGYLIVIGPLDQLWLKKIGKQMLTWITFPIYVALFSGLIYVIGYKLRAGETEWNELHLVDILPLGEKADWSGHTYASVYSPVNARYPVESTQPLAVFRSEFVGGFRGAQESSRATIEHRGNNFRAMISVPVWTSQLYVSDWWRQEESPMVFQIAGQGNEWRIEVENRSGRPTHHLALVVDGQVFELETVNPGKTRTFLRTKRSGKSLAEFVEQYGRHFYEVVSERQRAFGSNQRALFEDVPRSAIAASFASYLDAQGSHRNFLTPPRVDLDDFVRRGDAVLFAWVPDYAPVERINRFSTRRSHSDTLFRVLQTLP